MNGKTLSRSRADGRAARQPSAPPRAHPVTLLRGDAAVAAATLRVLAAAGAPLAWEEPDPAGADEARASAERTGLVLRGPLAPGERDAAAALRLAFDCFATMRPVRGLPGGDPPYAGRGVDLVVVSPGVGDRPHALEHRHTPTVAQALTLVSRTGCERVARLAFELAVAQNRATVTCATAAELLPLTEGTLAAAFAAVAEDYALIHEAHLPVETVARQLAAAPERVEVVLASEPHARLLAAVAAGVSGAAAGTPRVTLGDHVTLFEAPQDGAGPAGMLLAAVLLLRQVGERRVADALEHALVVTLHEGDGAAVGADAFADAVAGNLGRRLAGWRTRPYAPVRPVRAPAPAPPRTDEAPLVGVDVFLHTALAPRVLAPGLDAAAEGSGMRLAAITSGAAVVYPHGPRAAHPADHVRARFVARDGAPPMGDGELLALLTRLARDHHWTHVDKLHQFDGVPGFSPIDEEG